MFGATPLKTKKKLPPWRAPAARCLPLAPKKKAHAPEKAMVMVKQEMNEEGVETQDLDDLGVEAVREVGKLRRKKQKLEEKKDAAMARFEEQIAEVDEAISSILDSEAARREEYDACEGEEEELRRGEKDEAIDEAIEEEQEDQEDPRDVRPKTPEGGESDEAAEEEDDAHHDSRSPEEEENSDETQLIFAQVWLEQSGNDGGIPQRFTPCRYHFKAGRGCGYEDRCRFSHNDELWRQEPYITMLQQQDWTRKNVKRSPPPKLWPAPPTPPPAPRPVPRPPNHPPPGRKRHQKRERRFEDSDEEAKLNTRRRMHKPLLRRRE